MKSIYLTEEEIKKYPPFVLTKTNEAEILNYSETEIIKHFHYYNENKVYTLGQMEKYESDLKLVPELLIHKKVICDYQTIIAILLDIGYGLNLKEYAKQQNTSFNDLILTLQNIGKILEKLKYIRSEENKLTSFFIGDLQEGNILVDPKTKKIQFIDLDSCKIGNNRAFLTKYLEFLKTYSYVKIKLQHKYPWDIYNFSNNQNTDLYCYMVVILKLLFGIDITLLDLNEFYRQMFLLRKQGLPEPLFQIFMNLYSNVDNQNPYKLLDSIPSSFEKRRIL